MVNRCRRRDKNKEIITDLRQLRAVEEKKMTPNLKAGPQNAVQKSCLHGGIKKLGRVLMVGAPGRIWPKTIVGLYYFLILSLSPENSTL